MNFYPFHIGDFASHTRGLSLLENLAYRLLLDEYYLHECPLQGTPAQIAKSIGMKDNLPEVQFVLEKYFEPCEAGWSNQRADQEIEKYQAAVAQRIRAGHASAQRRLQAGNDRSTTVQQSMNHEPVTKNQEPDISSGSKDPSGGRARAKQLPEDFKPNDKHKALATKLGINLDQELEQFIDHHRARGTTMKDWNAALNTWIRNAGKFGAKGGKPKRQMLWNNLDKQEFGVTARDDDTF